jgi:hypothetical protein
MKQGEHHSHEARAKIGAKGGARIRYPVPLELLEDYKTFKRHGYSYAEALEMARASLKKKPAP